MKKAIFLDRDGTINIDHGYVHQIKDFKLIPKVKESILELKKQGYLIIIVTNQSGIERGYYTEEDMHNLHNHLKKIIPIDDIFFCPGFNLPCRKPNTGMVEEALKKYSINLNQSFMIGDKEKDIECGTRLNIKTISVDTGQKPYPRDSKIKPIYYARDLYEATQYIKNQNS